MHKRGSYRVIGYLMLRGARYYVRLRYPNVLRKTLTAVGSVAVLGSLIALVVVLSGRSNVNSLTP